MSLTFSFSEEELQTLSTTLGDKVKELGYPKSICHSLIEYEKDLIVLHILIGYQKLDIFISGDKDKSTKLEFYTLTKYFYPIPYVIGTINDDRQYELAEKITTYKHEPCFSREDLIEEIFCDFDFLPFDEYIKELHEYFEVDISRRN